MEPIIGIAGLTLLGYGLYKVIRTRYQATNARQRQEAEYRAAHQRRIAEAQLQQRERQRQLNLLARNMQLALLQLHQAPDFRRAASFAAQAKTVPLAFRQRQFRRFRPKLVGHMAARLRSGSDPELLVQSLAELLQHLGMAAYEAEYIKVEAEQLRPTRATPVRVSYEQRLAKLKSEHEQRVEALRGSGLDEEMLERLLEEENERFRETLLNLGDDQSPTPTA